MIKTRTGVTEIKGSRAEILADITVIFKALSERTGITREEIIMALNNAEKSASEIGEGIKNIDEEIRGLLEEIEQKIKEIRRGQNDLQ